MTPLALILLAFATLCFTVGQTFLGVFLLLLSLIFWLADLAVKEQNSPALKAENEQRAALVKDEEIIFKQTATYRGGIKNASQFAGTVGNAFILNKSFVFLGLMSGSFTYKLPFNRIIEAKLEYFQMGGTRGFLAAASGNVGRQLQETLNTLAITYLDDDNIERIANFQINGALTIPGEAVKAREFLDRLLDHKAFFSGRAITTSTTIAVDPVDKIQKLKALLDQDLITQEEFDEKKRKLLDEF